MKQNLNTNSNFFRFISLTLPLSFLLLSSITPKQGLIKKEASSMSLSNLLSCTQSDLIICNYGSIVSFVDALVAELNNQLNNCNGALADCSPSSTCCYYNAEDFTLDYVLTSGKNPYFYCTTESCNTFTCIGLVGGGTQHNDLTVANQNEIISKLRMIASAAVPCGAGNGSNKPINNYRVYRTGPSGSCSSDGPNCYNTSIRLEVTYLCGCQS